jgi:hypothetical protein
LASDYPTQQLCQILGYSPQKKRSGVVQEEMAAGKHSKREGTKSLVTPSFEIVTAYQQVLQASEGRDGTLKRILG